MRAIFTCLLVAAAVAAQAGERHTIHADRDATLFEHPEGALASGAGPACQPMMAMA